MIIIYTLIFFLYGLIFGSFFNVVGLRVPNKTLLKDNRSYCDTCDRTLTWKELIPIFSYIRQKGKCTTCHEKISLFYPFIELLTGLLFALTYLVFGLSNELILGLILISLVIPVTVSDLQYQRIPNRILLFFLPLLVGYRIIFPLDPFWNSLVGAASAFILLLVIILVSKGGMGMGDLKYFTLFGFVFGLWEFLLLFFLSTVFGTIGGLIIMKTQNKGRKTKIPFGPYIGLAALTVLYFGEAIIEWYRTLMHF